MNSCSLFRNQPVAKKFPNPRVVFGESNNLLPSYQVSPAIADVRNIHRVLLKHKGGAGRPHSGQAGIPMSPLENGCVRRVKCIFQKGEWLISGRRGEEGLPEDVNHQGAGLFATLMPPHAVGHNAEDTFRVTGPVFLFQEYATAVLVLCAHKAHGTPRAEGHGHPSIRLHKKPFGIHGLDQSMKEVRSLVGLKVSPG
jgi:hypothetical protein